MKPWIPFVTVVSVTAILLSGNVARSDEQPNRAKLQVSNVSLVPTGDDYNGSVNLLLERPGSPSIYFGLSFQHVRSLEDLYSKVRPAVDHLADELKSASDDFPKAH
jgi:hypothetical protein